MRRSLVTLIVLCLAVGLQAEQRTRVRRVRAHPAAAAATDPAAQWFVSTTGNNANACTSSGAACLTLAGVMAKSIAAGDIVQVAAGTYSSIVWTKSGSAGSPITIRGNDTSGCGTTDTSSDAYSIRKVRPNPGVTITGTTIDGEQVAVEVQANYVTFKCFKLTTGGYYLPKAQHDVTFSDSYIDGLSTGSAGFFVGSDAAVALTSDVPFNITITRNYITKKSLCMDTIIKTSTVTYNECDHMDNGETDHMHPWGDTVTWAHNYMHGNLLADAPAAHADCFQVYNQGGANENFRYAKNITIDSNTCLNFDEHIITSNEAGASGLMTNWTVTNNLFKGFRTGSSAGGSGFANTTNVLFYHNTLAGGTTFGCGRSPDAGVDAATVTVKNNLLDGTFGVSGTGSCTLTSSNNIDYTTVTFVDSANGDYHLTNASSGVGTGATGLGVSVDKDGCTRRSPPTLGMFEFSSASCS